MYVFLPLASAEQQAVLINHSFPDTNQMAYSLSNCLLSPMFIINSLDEKNYSSPYVFYSISHQRTLTLVKQ